MTDSPFQELLETMQKAQFFNRFVRFVGGKNAGPEHMKESTGTRSTLMRDGRVARVSTDKVKVKETPESKRATLTRRIALLKHPKDTVNVSAHPPKEPKGPIMESTRPRKDTPTTKFTMLRDGSTARISFHLDKALDRVR